MMTIGPQIGGVPLPSTSEALVIASSGTAATQASAGPDLVRITVTAQGRRRDLAVPGARPVGELLPDLGRIMELRESSLSMHGCRLLGHDGRELSVDRGFRAQGVDDGSIVHLSTDSLTVPTPLHDDLVEVVAEAVTGQGRPWRPALARRMTLGAGAALLTLGAVGLGCTTQLHDVVAGVLAAAVAAVLVSGAVVVSRSRQDHLAAVAIGWLGSEYAAVAGLVAAGSGPRLGLPLALAGIAGLLGGLAVAAGLLRERVLMMPLVVLGALAAAAGLLLPGLGHAAEVLTATLTLVVIAGSLLAWLALSLAGVRPQPPLRARDTPEAGPLDRERIFADVRIGDRLLLGMQCSAGLVLVVLVPVAVSLGVTGAVLATACCVVVSLRARQHLGGAQVLVGLLSGLLGLVNVAISVSLLHPEWGPALVGVLVASGLGCLSALLLPVGPSLRRGWLGDLLESVALVSLLPLLADATGLLTAVQR